MSQVIQIYCLIFLSLMTWSSRIYAGNAAESYMLHPSFPAAIQLVDKADGISIGKNLALVSDSSMNLSPKEIYKLLQQGEFSTQNQAAINYGMPHAAEWAAFFIYNPFPEKRLILLESIFTHTDQVDLYKLSGDEFVLLSSQGDQLPISQRDVISRQPVFALELSPGLHFFLLRQQAENSIQLYLKIWDVELFHQRNALELTAIGLLLGFHLVIAFYNFFLFISFRDRVYLYYVVYVFGNVIYQSCILGFMQYICFHVFGWETIDNRVMISAVDVVIISALLFSSTFLSLRSSLPQAMLWMRICGLISIANLVINIFISTYLGAFICLINSSLAIGILFTSGLVLCMKRYKGAYFFTLAWSFYLTGATGHVFSLMGVFPANELNHWMQLCGGAVEVVLLSLAVGQRMSMIQNRLTKMMTEQKQIEKIVKTAQFLQNISPEDAPSENIEFTYFTQAAENVGGDWLGMITFKQESKVYLCIGDVMGHGLSPALISVIAAGAVRGAVYASPRRPADERERLLAITHAINRALYDKCQEYNCFITFLLLSLDWQTGEVSTINAGHTALLRFGKGKVQKSSYAGSLLGMFQEPQFQPMSFRLEAGECLFLYTDGLIENIGSDGKPIRIREVLRILQEHDEIELAKRTLLDLTESRWGHNPPDDDTTMILLKWQGPSGPKKHLEPLAG